MSSAAGLPPPAPAGLRRSFGALKRRLRRVPDIAVERGVPPAWLGWRGVRHESAAEYLRRSGRTTGPPTVIHPETVEDNPLPGNVRCPSELSARAGWWGYSFRDVPRRRSGATLLATLPDCRVLAYRDGPKRNFTVAVLTADDRALALPQTGFRAGHAEMLRRGATPVRRKRAVWILERVYDNHSHWLTAHLGKLCLLRERDLLTGDLVLPRERTPAIDASLAMLNLDPADFPSFAPGQVMEVEELTIVALDRFRPEILRPVRDAMRRRRGPAGRKVLISRAGSKGRKLVNEEALWPELARRGFERVRMEELDLPGQIDLMAETEVLLAPHGAGLAGMIFCHPGAEVIEIADPAYPNPNFYAMASAMGHRYWLLHGEALGTGHPLEKDLRVDADALLGTLDRMDGRAPA